MSTIGFRAVVDVVPPVRPREHESGRKGPDDRAEPARGDKSRSSANATETATRIPRTLARPTTLNERRPSGHPERERRRQESEREPRPLHHDRHLDGARPAIRADHRQHHQPEDVVGQRGSQNDLTLPRRPEPSAPRGRGRDADRRGGQRGADEDRGRGS